MVQKRDIITWNDVIESVANGICSMYDNIDNMPSLPTSSSEKVYDSGVLMGRYGGPQIDSTGWAWSKKRQRGWYVHQYQITTTENRSMAITPGEFTRYSSDAIRTHIRSMMERHGIGINSKTGQIIRSNHIYYICQILRQWIRDVTYVLCYIDRSRPYILCKLPSDVPYYGYPIITDDYPMKQDFKTYINTVIVQIYKDVIVNVDSSHIKCESVNYFSSRSEWGLR